ncbi:MAG: response regulator [Flavobacteriales bacterium]
MKNTKSILILDDHSLFLKGLKVLIEETYEDCIIRTFSSIESLIKTVKNFDLYDLLISDMELPNENIYDLFSLVRSKSRIPILVVSMHKKIVAINQCKKIGVNGYILKSDDEYLSKAINETLLGNDFFSPTVKRLLNSAVAQNILISEREKEMIRCICKGYSNLEIAERLFISVETVKTHKRNIKSKLGLETNHEIIEFANENMII